MFLHSCKVLLVFELLIFIQCLCKVLTHMLTNKTCCLRYTEGMPEIMLLDSGCILHSLCYRSCQSFCFPFEQYGYVTASKQPWSEP